MGADEVWKFAPAYELPSWPFVVPAELASGEASTARKRYPVVIAGGGLAGLTLCCDLALRGVEVVLLDEDDTVGVRGASSRGICYAQKSLEVFDRLGIYERIRAKGITWSVGRTFSGADEVYAFNLKNESFSEQPPFINLQQFYLEWFLVERILEVAPAAIRWKHKVTKVEHGAGSDRQSGHDGGQAGGATVHVETPAGAYVIEADWLVDATGANSAIREAMKLPVNPSRSTDRWCITDVRFKKPFAVERWTWIDAPFNEGRAVWQHLMADEVWRLDYQMDEDADPETISRPEVAGARLRAQLGADVDFEFVWIGPYGYRDHLLETFRVGRTIFIGDSAHVVCPFGARGGNNGIQDAANLGWKLALVVQGSAPERLIDSYHHERHAAAVENLRVTSRTARFLAPRSAHEHRMRRAVVALARTHEFARRLANTGRMAQANVYPPSPWAPDGLRSLQNVVVGETTVMRLLADGTRFLGLWIGARDGDLAPIAALSKRWPLIVRAASADGDVARQLGAAAGTFVLVRPDAYVAAELAQPTVEAVEKALRQATSPEGEAT